MYNILNWSRAKTKDKTIIYMECPRCEQSIGLQNHKIDDHGRVAPSVVCPTQDCNFHEWIKLRKFINFNFKKK